MAEKILFIDLSHLRIGLYVEHKPMPNVPNYMMVRYKPPASNVFSAIARAMFGKDTETIVNVPQNSFIIVTKDQLGGISTYDKYFILLANERNDSLFMNKIFPEKFNEIIQNYNKLQEEHEIRRYVQEAQKVEASKETMQSLEAVMDIATKIQKLTKRRPEIDRFRGGD